VDETEKSRTRKGPVKNS